MTRAHVFTDPRLLGVTPEARLAAFAFEACAEDTGVLKINSEEIRASLGIFLSRADMPPTPSEVMAWIEELADARWILLYDVGPLRLGYLPGFGERQQGSNVCIGVKQTTGEVAAHLPMPVCVALKSHQDKAGQVRKMLPAHCSEDFTSCPCERFLTTSGGVGEAMVKGEESRGQVQAEAETDLRPRSENTQGEGELGEGIHPVGPVLHCDALMDEEWVVS